MALRWRLHSSDLLPFHSWVISVRTCNTMHDLGLASVLSVPWGRRCMLGLPFI